MFFFGRKSNYSRTSIKEQGIYIPQSKSALFAEKVWFGFMLLFALPFLLPFLFIALVIKIVNFMLPTVNKKTAQNAAVNFVDIYDDNDILEEEGIYDANKKEISPKNTVSEHITDIIREIENELPSEKDEPKVN